LICGGEEFDLFGGRSESWDDHVAVRIVVFFEFSWGGGHVSFALQRPRRGKLVKKKVDSKAAFIGMWHVVDIAFYSQGL
jgi:hypothetical protein